MKSLFLCLVVVFLAACSSTKSSNSVGAELKEQRLSTDFTDEGVKIYYTLTGKLEKIEVHGQADAWKGNVEALAEADAMAKLVKFVYGKDVSTERKIKIIGKALEKAQDESLDSFKNKDGVIELSESQLASEIDKAPSANRSTSASRQASALNQTLVETVTTLTSRGRLTAVRKVKDFQLNSGKTYVAVYVWTDQDQKTADFLRARMRGQTQ
jgi:hypothetical protein